MIKTEVIYRQSGIYKIENILNGDFYVGSSIDVYKRYYQHRTLLKRNKHWSTHLQNSWNKYGADNFVFTVLEYSNLDVNGLRDLEQQYLDNLKPIYNLSMEVFSLSIYPRPESHIKNISYALKMSPVVQSEKYKKKVSESVKELWRDNEYREMQILSHNSPIGRMNHSKAAKKNWENKEFRVKVGESVKMGFHLGDNKSSKFNGNDILNIRNLADSGVSTNEICRMYDSPYKTIRRIITRETWTFV